MIVTYIILFGYMSLIGVKDPYLNAVTPALGFNLSTWSMTYIEYIWELRHKLPETIEAEILDSDSAKNYLTFTHDSK